MSLNAKAFVAVVIAIGFPLLYLGLAGWESADLTRYLCYYTIAMLACSLKAALPSVTGTMSVSVLFVLIGLVELSFGETLFLGASATLVQYIRQTRQRPKLSLMGFHIANMSTAITATSLVFDARMLRDLQFGTSLLLILAAATYFVFYTFPSAALAAMNGERSIIGHRSRGSLLQFWKKTYFWSFPYYIVGAAVAGLFNVTNRYLNWQTALLVLPVIYLAYRSYYLYLGRFEDDKIHAEEMAALHLRTIEALALAIEAKDHTTHDHLQRVQIYALQIGRDLKLSADEIEALRAASLLHDIGKLAVPEHIISKPGRLTPEEFEKMKIHPVIGAEILERVQFPYPVVPMVRSHHERWDGSGYPHGLKGDAIPIGARILAVVDCFDAMASNRQYRRAMPLHEAMGRVEMESGKSFDPKVVAVLKRRYQELEELAKQTQVHARLSVDVKIENGLAPAAGFESARGATGSGHPESGDFLAQIAAARQEVHALFELSQDLGNSLSLDETLSVLAVRLKRIIPYHAIAIYVHRDDKLIPEHVGGDDARLFGSLQIPFGEGLSGWVAENRKPIVNGNPSVESSYLNDPKKASSLKSALSIPLEGLNHVIGVLTLYHEDRDAFTRDHLRILLAISSKVSLSIENALKYKQAETSAITDYLTGLPNARSLFLHLDSELVRSRRLNIPLAVLVCDLDGFKQVNDRFGHLEGNRLLRMVAKALRDACREFEYVGRMGGDEFVLVLPGLAGADVQSKMMIVEQYVREAGVQAFGEDLLSASVGEARFPDDGADAEQLVSEADRRMYKNKREGRHYSDQESWAANWNMPPVTAIDQKRRPASVA